MQTLSRDQREGLQLSLLGPTSPLGEEREVGCEDPANALMQGQTLSPIASNARMLRQPLSAVAGA